MACPNSLRRTSLRARRAVPLPVALVTQRSIIASVALAAHLHPLMGVEANARQYVPSANAAASRAHPDVCKLTDGHIRTGSIRGDGIGYRWEEWH